MAMNFLWAMKSIASYDRYTMPVTLQTRANKTNQVINMLHRIQQVFMGKCLFGSCLPMTLPMALLVAAMLLATPVVAQEHEHDTQQPARVLGKIDFPTSAKQPKAQAAFIRGMLLLHLFEYPFAREEFIAAQEIEPNFAMAYWGEAMTHNHPIWDEQDLVAAREVLLKLSATAEQRLAVTEDPKEQAYLASLELLYGQGSKRERDQAYAQALELMALQYPNDHEVQLFYAMSLFGVNAGVRDIPSYMLSTALAQNVFSANPQHPGAAHYLIHGVDDPDHAVLGLTAARALAKMAPDAGHSLHMTSHIFTALGMWDEVVKANENAAQVQNGMRIEQGEPARHWGHYNFWLLYGLLQQGRNDDALALLKAAYKELQAENKAPENRMILEPDRSITGSVVQMWARYLIETRDWTGSVSDWKFKLGDSFDPNLNYSFVQGMRAAHAGQPSEATQYLGQFRALQSELTRLISQKDEVMPSEQQFLIRLKVLEQELLAGIEFAKGESQQAARYAAEASKLEGTMPYAFGPPFVDWPSAELEGEMLLEARKYAEAEAAFKLQLKRARLRSASLEGLATALEKQGKDSEAAYTRQRLERIQHSADVDADSESESESGNLPLSLEEN